MPVARLISADASADSLTTRLAELASARGDRIAVRYKERDLVRACSWRALAAQLDESATAGGGHALGLRWLLALLASASVETTEALGGEQDVLWLEPESAHDALAGWLEGGAALAVGEAIDTQGTDRRELAPTLVLARGSWYDALADELTSRASQGSGLRAALLRWALRVGAQSPRSFQRALARLLVLRPLADQLGLTRTRLALVRGPLEEPARTLFAALDVPLRFWIVRATRRASRSRP